jgi:hypothetical protein
MIFSLQFFSNAQNLEKTIEFADIQFDNKNYQLAVKEYQRALFFADGKYTDYLYRQIANSFFVNSQFEQALYFYELSYKTSKSDSLKYEMMIARSLCYLYLKDFKHSILELANIPDSSNEYFSTRKSFYQAISYFGSEDYEKSKNYFLALVPESDQKSRIEIENLFTAKKYLFKPNPNTAKVLSILLPGSGQMYAGDIKNSVNSLLLTGSMVLLGIVMVQEYSILDAFLTAFPWFMRYYRGGFENAFKIALDKRAIKRDNAYKKVLELIKESNQIPEN